MKFVYPLTPEQEIELAVDEVLAGVKHLICEIHDRFVNKAGECPVCRIEDHGRRESQQAYLGG